MNPKERVAAARDRWGDAEVVRRCVMLLRNASDAPVAGDGLELAVVLGRLTDREWLAGGKPPGHAYWARVWAARALRYVWDDAAGPAVVAALDDEHWRVREMAAKVAGDHEVADSGNPLAVLAADRDEVPRVRIAAVRALAAVGESEHSPAVIACVDDDDPAIAGAAVTARRRMERRLDRRF